MKLKVKRWVIALSTIASVSVIGTMVSSLINVSKYSNLNNVDNIDNKKEVNELTKLSNTDYLMRDNPIISFNENQYSNFDFNLYYNEGISPEGFEDTIKNLLKKQSYWVNSKVPNNLDFRIIEKIQEYKNPSLNYSTPAVKVVPVIDNDFMLDEITVSLVGTKKIPGVTYALNSMTESISNTNNKNASLIYIPDNVNDSFQGLKSYPSGDELEQYLFNHKDIFKSLFANLPKIGSYEATTNHDNNEYVINGYGNNPNEGVVINFVGENKNSSNNKYKVYDYQITLPVNYTKSPYGSSAISSDIEISYNLSLYIARELFEPSSSTTLAESSGSFASKIDTIFTNVAEAKDVDYYGEIVKVQELSTVELERIRSVDPLKFIFIVVSLLHSHQVNMIPATDYGDYDINITQIGTNTIATNVGVAMYKITVKRVMVDGGQQTGVQYAITQNVVISGLKPIIETQFVNNLSVASLDSISNHYPSEYNIKSNSSLEKNILKSIAKTTSGKPTYYYNGGVSTKSPSDEVAEWLKVNWANIDYSGAKYDDNTGIISNIKVLYRGYYDLTGEYNENITKQIFVSLSGFKTQVAHGVTSISNILCDEIYREYPAQSFLIDAINDQNAQINFDPNNTEPYYNAIKAKLDTGFLPIDVTATTELNNKLDEIKHYIKSYVKNLPSESYDESKWELKNLKLDNRTGEITGDVVFPYIYKERDNQLIITENTSKESLKFRIIGFSQVNASTSFTTIEVQEFAFENEFGAIQAATTKSKTLQDFKSYIGSNPSDPETQKKLKTIINYWCIERSRVISNRWPTPDFALSLNNPQIGIKDIQISDNENLNTFTISFSMGYFDSNFNFVSMNSTIQKPTIVLNGFKTNKPITRPSFVAENVPVSVTDIINEGVENNYKNVTREKIEQLLKNGGTDPVLGDVQKMFFDYINSELAVNIKDSEKPVYKINSIIKNSESESILDVNIKFLKNYYDENGQWVSTDKEGKDSYKIQINNFDIIGSTDLPPVINVPREIITPSGETSPDKFYTALEAVNKPDVVTKLKKLIYDNLNRPVDTADKTIDFNVNNQDKDGKVTNDNGEIYFGKVDNVQGTITLYVKFKANQWFKNSVLQTSDSEIMTIKLTGFKRLISDYWYKQNILLDATVVNKTKSAQNLWNAMASNISEGNWSKLDQNIQNEIITDIKSKILQNPQSAIKNDLSNLSYLNDESIAENNSGAINAKFSIYGNNIISPENGLPYKNKDKPFKFDAQISGFTPISKTTTNSNVVFDGSSSETAPNSAKEIKNFLGKVNILTGKRENIVRLFSGIPNLLSHTTSLDQDNLEKFLNDSVIIPKNTVTVSNNSYTPTSEDNIVVDYEHGSVTIKQIFFRAYFDDKFNLVTDAFGTAFNDEQPNWSEFNGKKLLLIQNTTLQGFKPAKVTQIVSSPVELYGGFNIPKQVIGTTEDYSGDFKDVLASTFLDKVKEKNLGKTLIYRPVMIDETGAIVAQNINNLDRYFINFNTNQSFYPDFETVEAKANNIDGTIEFKIKVKKNFFVQEGNKIVFKTETVPAGQELVKKVKVTGFKRIKETKISSIVNIMDLYTTEEQKDLSWFGARYELKDGNYTAIKDINQSVKTRIKELILNSNNVTQFITDWVDEYEDADLDIRFAKDANEAIDFGRGVIEFDLVLNKYIDSTGNIKTNAPKTQRVTIVGFKKQIETTLIEKNINKYTILQLSEINYHIADDELKKILSSREVLENIFTNIPNDLIFQSATDFVINSITKTPGTNPTIKVDFTFKNAFSKPTANSNSLFLKDITGSFNITGFEDNTQTTLDREWNVSNRQQVIKDELSKLNKNGADVNKIKDILNKEIIYDGKKMLLCNSFMDNAVVVLDKDGKVDLTKTTKITAIDEIEPSPIDGKMKLRLKYTNYYNQEGKVMTDEFSDTITIIGLNAVKKTLLRSEVNASRYVTLDLLPSLVDDDEETRKEFVKILNSNRSLKESMFYNLPSKADGYEPLEITDVEVKRYNDVTGKIVVNLKYKNYFDESGNYNKDETLDLTDVSIQSLNKAKPTSSNITNVSLDSLFGGIENVPTILEDNTTPMTNVTPSQYVGVLKTRMDALLPPDRNPDDITIQMMNEFNKNLYRLISPLYNAEKNFNYPDKRLPFQSKQKLTNRQNSIFRNNIVSLGTTLVTKKVGSGKFVEENSKKYVQKVDQLYSSFDYNIKEVEVDGKVKKIFDIYNTLKIDDRMGTITVKIKFYGYWKTENSGQNIKFNMEPNAGSSIAKPDGEIDLVISGFQKDTNTQNVLTNSVIMAVSIGGGVLVLLLVCVLIFVILKLKKGL